METVKEVMSKYGETAIPRIIVLSSDRSTDFEWMSDGWHTTLTASAYSRSLMGIAHQCIESGTSTVDVIRRLWAAGFEVQRDQ